MKKITLKKMALVLIILFALAIGGILQTTTVDAATGNYWRHHPRPTPTPTPTPTSTPAQISTPTPSPTLTPAPSPTVSPTASSTPSPSPQASIQVYSDPACTAALSSINWGALSPGTTSTLVLYVRNQGNTAVTLSKTLSNWNPSTLSTYLILNWDYSNQALSPSTTLQVTLSLIVSPNISTITNFSFSTTITAKG